MLKFLSDLQRSGRLIRERNKDMDIFILILLSGIPFGKFVTYIIAGIVFKIGY